MKVSHNNDVLTNQIQVCHFHIISHTTLWQSAAFYDIGIKEHEV